jgi:hypothetical protein
MHPLSVNRIASLFFYIILVKFPKHLSLFPYNLSMYVLSIFLEAHNLTAMFKLFYNARICHGYVF